MLGCAHPPQNADDPFEPINRQIYRFNMAADAIFIKPPSKIYQAVLPQPIRSGIYNAFNNVYMLPTVANDVLQGQIGLAFQDSARFIINSSIGLGGVLDVATAMKIPVHYNDLGLTMAKYGIKKSPYIVLPIFGPTTIRDGIGTFGDYTLFMPFPYIEDPWVLNGILAVHFIDVRARFFETEELMTDALDKYAFIRDAYLQNRNALITGTIVQTTNEDSGELYVEENDEDEAINKAVTGQS